jgi:hypothetical protein
MHAIAHLTALQHLDAEGIHHMLPCFCQLSRQSVIKGNHQCLLNVNADLAV